MSSSASSSLTSLPTTILRSELVLDQKVDIGALGEVWKAKWKGTKGEGRTVAVKIVPIKIVTPNQQVKALKEAYILSQLEHPHFLKIFGALFENQELWIVTELFKGTTLYKRLEQNTTIPWETRLRWSYQMAAGVQLLHAQPDCILHRDIKSVNFIVSEDSSIVKLIHFGFGKFTTVESLDPIQHSPLRWAAPETLKYPPTWTTGADIYSLGMTFYEVATCKIPFHEIDDAALSALEAFPRPEILVDLLPKEFVNIIHECWRFETQQRIPAYTLLERLGDLAATYIPPLPPPIPLRQSLPANRGLTMMGTNFIGSFLQNFGSLVTGVSSSFPWIWKPQPKISAPDRPPRECGFVLPAFGKHARQSLLGKKARIKFAHDHVAFSLYFVTVTLNINASVEIYCEQWSILVTSPQLTLVKDAHIYEGKNNSQLVLLKSGIFEEGLSLVNDLAHHFFVVPYGKTFTLRFQAKRGIKRVEFDRRCRVLLFDLHENAVVYHTPRFIGGHIKDIAGVEWVSEENELKVEFPTNIELPVILSFNVSFKHHSSPLPDTEITSFYVGKRPKARDGALFCV